MTGDGSTRHVAGTYINTKVKRQQALAKAKAEAKKDAEDKSN